MDLTVTVHQSFRDLKIAPTIMPTARLRPSAGSHPLLLLDLLLLGLLYISCDILNVFISAYGMVVIAFLPNWVAYLYGSF